MTGLFNALIRTHHITSRKKVAKLKHAARLHNVNALLRSGGAPGIMYVQGHEQSVRAWVATVQVYSLEPLVACQSLTESESEIQRLSARVADSACDY